MTPGGILVGYSPKEVGSLPLEAFANPNQPPLAICLPTVEACFMELRSLLVGAPQGDFRNSKRSEALIGQMSVFGLHLSILLTFFSGLHITYNSY